MKNSIQKIALGLFICSTFYATAQTSYTPMYAELTLVNDAPLTTSEKIVREVGKIVQLTEDLMDADEKQEKRIKNKIASLQSKISYLKDDLEAEAAVLDSHGAALPFAKHDFDIAERSLLLKKFDVRRNGNFESFELCFETRTIGKVKIAIVSPGGELLEALVVSDFDGKLSKEIVLNTEPGKIYFLNIQVGSESTTKMLRFK